jgi:hypothetical protein
MLYVMCLCILISPRIPQYDLGRQTPHFWDGSVTGIQVKQTKQGSFILQAKYTNDLIKKFNMAELNPVSTLMITKMVLDLDENGEADDQREYRSMIGPLLYRTMTRPDIQFIVCLCARFQASPCSSHQQANQWIFRYLKYTLKFWIWYSASSSLDLVHFSMLILPGAELIEKALLVHVIFLDILLFVGLLINNLLLHNPP